jgi:3-deoxy-D-arabino-heptulosonate 7-phosphate (DAHP) synthase class II
MARHDTWVNRYIGLAPDSEVFYQAVCLCKWSSDRTDEPDRAHEEGIAHLKETSEPIPEHMTWLNMGIEWLDPDGAKRVVYTAICTCGWMGERQTDPEEARLIKLAHEENPVSPDKEGD